MSLNDIKFPDIKIEIPLDSGGVLLCVWIGWKLLDFVGLTYYGFSVQDFVLFLGVVLLIFNGVDWNIKGGAR